MSCKEQCGQAVRSSCCRVHRSVCDALGEGRRVGQQRRSPSHSVQSEALKEFEPPRTAAELRDLLAHSIVEIRSGKLDPKLANSISYLGTGFLRALEVSDLEARLRALETPTEDGHGKSEAQS